MCERDHASALGAKWGLELELRQRLEGCEVGLGAGSKDVLGKGELETMCLGDVSLGLSLHKRLFIRHPERVIELILRRGE